MGYRSKIHINMTKKEPYLAEDCQTVRSTLCMCCIVFSHEKGVCFPV